MINPEILNKLYTSLLNIQMEEHRMAKTDAGKKIVPVRPYKKAKPGGTYKTVPVPPHRRSTPNK